MYAEVSKAVVVVGVGEEQPVSGDVPGKLLGAAVKLLVSLDADMDSHWMKTVALVAFRVCSHPLMSKNRLLFGD